jgi:hypothetical protein
MWIEIVGGPSPLGVVASHQCHRVGESPDPALKRNGACENTKGSPKAALSFTSSISPYFFTITAAGWAGFNRLTSTGTPKAAARTIEVAARSLR